MTWTPPATTCVRTAWLDLRGDGTVTIPLENWAAGYFCSSLDLGSPDVREVKANRPDADGIDDRTQFMGGRAVTAQITALAGAGAQIDAVASSFAPYMVPSARPILHYVLDRPGAAERVLTLRPAAYAWQVAGDNQRDIQLAFVAADPIVRDPNVQTVTAWSGSAAGPGRTYPLAFNRAYPPGIAASVGIVHSNGDVPVRPLLRIYGPIGGAVVQFVGLGGTLGLVAFVAGYTIPAGGWVDVDTLAHTAYANSDPTQNVLAQLDFTQLMWPVLPVGVDIQMALGGVATSGVSQVQAIWQDGYLS
jgi:hypothetical protein